MEVPQTRQANEKQSLLSGNNPTKEPTSTTKHTLYAVASIALVALLLFGGVSWYAIDPSSDPNTGGSTGEQVQAVMQHLQRLEDIAKGGNNSRSILNNYEASALYVENLLNKSNGYFSLSRQYFTAPVWELTDASLAVVTTVQPALLELDLAQPLGRCQVDADFSPFRYSGSSDGELTLTVTKAAQTIDSVSQAGDGCEASQYTVPGSAWVAIATDNSTCNVYEKAKAAQEAGASALIVHRVVPLSALPGGRVRDAWWTPESTTINIPCIGASHTTGKILIAGAQIKLNVQATTTMAETFNVLVETVGGDPNKTVVVGAHLDSVPGGPGINDNGSGSAAILQMALNTLSGRKDHRNKIVFAWFGAEEVGLIGSRFYVREFLAKESAPYTVRANLNFDMLGSPNFKRILYAATSCPENVRDGCRALQDRFAKYFTANGLSFQLNDFSSTGGSDYFPFIATGIPAGSIATGAGSVKTMEERTVFGGIADAPLDSCYHQACDTVENINVQAFGEMIGAAEHVFNEIIDLEDPAQP